MSTIKRSGTDSTTFSCALAALACWTIGAPAAAAVVYEGTARIRVVSSELGLLPFEARPGDEFRFRLTVDEDTRESPALSDSLGSSEYENAIRHVEVFVAGRSVPLPPTSLTTSGLNRISIRNDAVISQFVPISDAVIFNWQQSDPTTGHEYDLFVSVEDNEVGALLSDQRIPTHIDYALATGWSIGFNVYNAAREGDSLDMELTGFSIVDTSGPSLTFSQFTGRTVPAEAFLGVATAGQLPGATAATPEPKHPVALWMNAFDEYAVLDLGFRSLRHIESFSLRCGVAGQEGDVVWSTTAAPGRSSDGSQRFRIYRNELRTDPPEACGGGEANIARLRTLAQGRRLYLELDAPTGALRAQLWPRSLYLREPGLTTEAHASDQQIVGAGSDPQWQRARASLTFAEGADTLTTLGYVIPDRQRFRSVSLFCGPAGHTGELVAVLPLDKGVMSNRDISATTGFGICGVEINNIASLLEAVLRGHVYAEFVDVAPSARVLRGQFRAP